MNLILFRHGLAVEREEFQLKKLDDSLRPLVEKGKARSEMMAKFLSQSVEEVDLLVSSPYLRATQTAAILKRILKPAQYQECVELIPSAPQVAFANWLAANASTCRTVLAVGHCPQLEVFASWCLGRKQDSVLNLKKSGVINLQVEGFANLQSGKAVLQYFLNPKLLEPFFQS